MGSDDDGSRRPTPGILPQGGHNWIAGVVYLQNVIRALNHLPEDERPGDALRRMCKRLGRAVVPQDLRQRREARLAAERFRRSGEPNTWLYDHFSLTMLLSWTGFTGIVRKTYTTSDIPEWSRFDLDRSTLGDYAIEPSLYVEARTAGSSAPRDPTSR